MINNIEIYRKNLKRYVHASNYSNICMKWTVDITLDAQRLFDYEKL